MEYRSVNLELQQIPYKDFTGYDAQAIADKLRLVIEGEGPVVDDFLELKVLKSYSIFQRGSQIAPFLRGILLSLCAVTTIQLDCDGQEHFVFWPERFRGHESEIEALTFSGYEEYRVSGQRDDLDEGCFRAIGDYPQMEVFNAMKAQLESGEPVDREELLTLTNHALGFMVKGRQIRETLEMVLKAGIANGTFVYNRRGGTIRLR